MLSKKPTLASSYMMTGLELEAISREWLQQETLRLIEATGGQELCNWADFKSVSFLTTKLLDVSPAVEIIRLFSWLDKRVYLMQIVREKGGFEYARFTFMTGVALVSAEIIQPARPGKKKDLTASQWDTTRDS